MKNASCFFEFVSPKSLLNRITMVFVLLLLFQKALFAQETAIPKYALVIGNGNYSGLSRLANPVNDANDVADVLSGLGFTVDKLLDASLEQMEEAVLRLRNRLSSMSGAYGFFFYAGHGVQSAGENYLIPVNANIPSETFLRNRAVSVQILLDELNQARNSLNVVVLDACRDNPFGWGRSGNRGLAVISGQPAGSIIVYATSAGQQASDGQGRNGLFTSQLLNNLKDPNLEVNEVFRRTGSNVSRASNNQQIPAIYSQFFEIAYLGKKPDESNVLAQVQQTPQPAPILHPASQSPSILQPVTPSTPNPQPQPIAPPQATPAPQPAPSPPQVTPSPQPISQPTDRSKRFTTLGAAVGTTFAEPWLTLTIHGTFTMGKGRGSAFELGLDYGGNSGIKYRFYNSFYPFMHYLYFNPFKNKGGWYIGGGMGWMFGSYYYDRRQIDKDGGTINTPAADIIAGVLLQNFLDISYTLRTNFVSASNKLAVGYSYRFK